MNEVTLVIECDKHKHTLSQVRDFVHGATGGKLIACREGDALVELEAFEEMMKEAEKAAQFHTGPSLLVYMKVMHKLCKDAIIERNEKEPNGS